MQTNRAQYCFAAKFLDLHLPWGGGGLRLFENLANDQAAYSALTFSSHGFHGKAATLPVFSFHWLEMICAAIG